MFDFMHWLPLIVFPFLLTSIPLYRADAHPINVTLPKLLGTFSFPKAAFTSIYPFSEGNNSFGNYDLILSSFSILESDVAIVRGVGKYIGDVTKMKVESLTNQMKWPNDVTGVPPEVFRNDRRFAVIPDGFIVPTKEEGSVTLIETDASPDLSSTKGDLERYVISSGKGQWFYHRVLWRDMDKDGRLDALTCRAQRNILGATKSDLIWFQQPEGDEITKPWDLNIMASGPDVFMLMLNMTNSAIGTREVIITAEYFKPRFRLFWTEDPIQNWANVDQIRSRDIYKVTTGHPFDLMYADLNNDGRMEITLTINSAKHGSVMAFEVPDDFRVGKFIPHVLASGYISEISGMGTGGPGSPILSPSKHTNSKPSIFVSGDDSSLISLLTPCDPRNPADWTYHRNDFLKTHNSTIGRMSIADVDNDGKKEMFVPSYEDGLVFVYQLD